MEIEYFVLDPVTGDGIGIVSNVDETDDGAFGCVAYFDSEQPATYQWLGGLTLLRVEEATAEFRNSSAYRMANHLVR